MSTNPSGLTEPTVASRNQERATGAGTDPCPGIRAGSNTDRSGSPVPDQGPVGHHQVHLHRLHLTPAAAGEQPQRGVRGDRTHPPTLGGASSGRCPPTTLRERANSAACAPTTSLRGPTRSGRPSRPAPGAPSPAGLRPPPPSGPPRTPRPAPPRPDAPPAPLPATPAGPAPGPAVRSTSARCSRDKAAVACTTSTACRSPITPSVSAANVPGHLVHQRPGQPHEAVPQTPATPAAPTPPPTPPTAPRPAAPPPPATRPARPSPAPASPTPPPSPARARRPAPPAGHPAAQRAGSTTANHDRNPPPTPTAPGARHPGPVHPCSTPSSPAMRKPYTCPPTVHRTVDPVDRRSQRGAAEPRRRDEPSEAEAAQLLGVALPVLGHLDVQVEVHPLAEERLDAATRVRAHLA